MRNILLVGMAIILLIAGSAAFYFYDQNNTLQYQLQVTKAELNQNHQLLLEAARRLTTFQIEISSLKTDLQHWKASSASYKGKYNASQNKLEKYEQLVTQLQAEAEQAQQQGSWLNLLSLLLGL